MATSSNRHTVRGLTLTELLVIVTILCVVGLVAYPVFEQRKYSGGNPCVGNIKHLTLSHIMYSSDNNDRLCAMCEPETHRTWVNAIAPYCGNCKLVCPLDPNDTISYGANALAFYDPSKKDSAPPSKFPPMGAYKYPQETIMLTETGAEDDLVTQRRNTYKSLPPDAQILQPEEARPILRHDPLAMITYMDGHVKGVRVEKFYLRSKAG